MPIKHVYGKRPRNHGAAVTAFAWSSPEESPAGAKPQEHEAVNEDDSREAVAAFGLKETHESAPSSPARQRRALGTRNANSLVRSQVLVPTIAEDLAKQDVRRSPRLRKTRPAACECAPNYRRSPMRQSTPPLANRDAPSTTPRLGTRDPVLRPKTQTQSPKRDSDLNLAEDTRSLDPVLNALLDLVTDKNCAKEPIPFKTWTADVETDFLITKVAEASFAQVYLLQRRDPTGDPREDQSILKLISLNPTAGTAACPDSRPPKVKDTSSDMLKVVSEIKLLDRMTEIPGFTNLREVSVLRGQPSTPFIAAWKDWNKKRRKHEKSYFPDPSRKANYCEDQLWAVIEMDHAGFDLEHPDTIIEDVESVWDVFWGVAIALAKGEEDVKFEHRDLHLGNVCVTRRSTPTESERQRLRLGASGLETTIIDYTLSRAEIETAANGLDVVCIDLAEEGIFDGDASIHYQYDLYRYMRSAIHLGDPLRDFRDVAENQMPSAWLESHLTTNVLWLHYLLHELWPKISQPDSQDGVLQQAGERTGSLTSTKRLALQELREELRLENWASGSLQSARDLVLLSFERSWLQPRDIMGDADEVDDLAAGLSQLEIARDVQSQSAALPTAETSTPSGPPRSRRKKAS